MYLINRDENSISKLKKKSFSELQFKERQHLQEWITKNPESLGEELLIIQKEFAGFDDTRERLDLLALDKQGNLVIIENKLDDSGKDVTWQIIKYASYCANLTKQDVINIYQDYLGSSKDAKEELTNFFDGNDIDEIIINQGLNSQRLIIVAANFRKEITSSVIWLINYKIRIQCIKASVFELEDQVFLNFEQILPQKETEEYIISIANKAQDEIEVQESSKIGNTLRFEFWERFLSSIPKDNPFMNLSPTKDSWMNKGIGVGGVSMTLGVTRKKCRCLIYFGKASKEENKKSFDFLFSKKDEIEKVFGDKLIWDRSDENVTSSIKYEIEGLDYYNEEDWNKIYKFFIDAIKRTETAFKKPLEDLNKYLKQK